MVEIIPEIRKPSGLERFMEMMASGLRGGSEGGQHIADALRGRDERKQLGELIGQDVSNIRDPGYLKQILGGHLDREAQAAKLKGEYEADSKNYETIKNAFGEKFADVWLATGQGERTALTKSAIEARARGLDLDEMLSGEVSPDFGKPSAVKTKSIRTPTGEEFELPQIEIPPEMTPADRVKYRGALRKENAPIFSESKNKIKGLKGERERLNILGDLSNKVPDGLGRLFINKEGNIRPLAQIMKLVPPEAERFIKTVNDFISTAKDIFGSRVTNYDIQVFKQRLPSLINSKEGRDQIIKQMGIFNEIESNYYDALDKVYKSYGLGNISQEEAEQLAQEIIAPGEQQLRQEFEMIGQQKEQPQVQQNNSLGEGKIMMFDPEGNPLHVPIDEVERLLELGAIVAE